MTVIVELSDKHARRVAEMIRERGGTRGNFMLRQIEDQLEGKVERSMIEWQPMTETPEDCEEILIRYTFGAVDLDTAVMDEVTEVGQMWHLDNRNISEVEAWAHLPEKDVSDAEE